MGVAAHRHDLADRSHRVGRRNRPVLLLVGADQRGKNVEAIRFRRPPLGFVEEILFDFLDYMGLSTS